MATITSAAGGLSLDAMIMSVQKSNQEAQRALAEDAADGFEAKKKALEKERSDIRKEEKDVSAESEALEDHVEKGPEWWDKFNPLSKGKVHEKQTEAHQASVARESADVAREESDLKVVKKEMSDALQDVRDTVDAQKTSFDDTTTLLSESADVAEMTIGRINI